MATKLPNLQHGDTVEIEIKTTEKSGGFIGTLYLNKNENAAVTLVSESLATVQSFSADSCGSQRANNNPYIPQDEAKKARRNVRMYSHFCRGHLTNTQLRSGLIMMKLRPSKRKLK